MIPTREKMDSECEEMVRDARTHGLQEADEPAFCMWVGIEVFERREVGNFSVLIARARELVLMFYAERRNAFERNTGHKP